MLRPTLFSHRKLEMPVESAALFQATGSCLTSFTWSTWGDDMSFDSGRIARWLRENSKSMDTPAREVR
jgi:hypothetical protein